MATTAFPRTIQAVLAVLATLVVGCGSFDDGTAGGDEARKISVQLNWFPDPQFGGLYAALHNGHFETQGLDVELIKGGAEVPSGQLVASGNVEFAVMSSPQIATLRARGGKATGVFASFQTAPRVVLLQADSSHDSLESLWKGEGRIMADTGLAWIRWVDSKYGESTLSFVPYAGSLAPFLSGDVLAMQAFAIAEPIQLATQDVAVKEFVVATTGYDPYDSVLTVNDDFLSGHPDVVARFTTAVARGWEDYLRDPDPTNSVIADLNPDFDAQTLEMAAAKLREYVRSPQTETHRLGWMSDDRWNTLLDQLVSIGELTKEQRDRVGRTHVNPMLTPDSGEGVAEPSDEAG